jgi:prepilin-type N-terminal cleavage/methylation domain-containing protein
MTLIELLVVLAVLGVLLALALPALSAARARSQRVKCLENVRSLGTVVVAYSVDFKGYFPTWVSDGPSTSGNPSRWPRYTQQGGRLFNRTRWIEYSGMDASLPVYRCPANGEYRAVGRKAIFDYYGSDAMYADPKFLDPELPREGWQGKFGGRAQFIDSVRFPSAKVGFFEWYVWHAWRGAYVEGPVERRGLSVVATTGASTMWFLDGSAAGLRYSDALPSVERGPYWYSHPVFLTAHGIWGRDRASIAER